MRGCGFILPLQPFICGICSSGLFPLSLSQHRNLYEGHTLLLWDELCSMAWIVQEGNGKEDQFLANSLTFGWSSTSHIPVVCIKRCNFAVGTGRAPSTESLSQNWTRGVLLQKQKNPTLVFFKQLKRASVVKSNFQKTLSVLKKK